MKAKKAGFDKQLAPNHHSQSQYLQGKATETVIKAAKFNTQSMRTFEKLQCRKTKSLLAVINRQIKADLGLQHGQRRAAAVTERPPDTGRRGWLHALASDPHPRQINTFWVVFQTGSSSLHGGENCHLRRTFNWHYCYEGTHSGAARWCSG